MCKDNCPCRNGTIFVKDKVTKSSPFFGHMPIPPLPDSCQTKITDATKQEQDSCPGFQQVAIAFEHQGKRFQYRFFFFFKCNINHESKIGYVDTLKYLVDVDPQIS